MREEEAWALKRQIEKKPKNISLRIRLLNCLSESDRGTDVEAWLTQYKWMIENHPTATKLSYVSKPERLLETQMKSIAECWSAAINRDPKNPVVVGTAGKFFMGNKNLLAAELLERAEALAPQRADLSIHLHYVYMAIAESEEYREELVSRVFEVGDITLGKRMSPGERDGVLVRLVDFAIAAGALSKAKIYANARLKLAIKRGISFRQFMAHSDLGLIALRQGNISDADNELLLAAECEFFPSLSFAQEMLKAGRIAVVQKFLDRCVIESENDKFSNEYHSLLTKWAAELRSGHMPIFDFNELV